MTVKAGVGFVHKSGASPEKRMVETFGSGVAWIDYDNDGFQDLFFVNGTPDSSNALYRNNRDGTFTDITARAGVAGNEGTRPSQGWGGGWGLRQRRLSRSLRDGVRPEHALPQQP